MNRTCLDFDNPIRDAISRIRFAPHSNNLLISSWDSSLRLYDVDSSKIRLEASTEAVVLDCCFQSETAALSANSDGSIHRCDLHSSNDVLVGNHEDVATCIEYSDETGQIISAGWDRKILLWDTRSTSLLATLNNKSDLEVESMSVTGFRLMVGVGSSVHIYDLRKCNQPVQPSESVMDLRIKCVRPIRSADGFVVGSIDGRVSLEYLKQSNSNNEGYVFRCHPRGIDGKQHFVTVNDIEFSPYIAGAFVTGDNEGYATIWDARSKKRLYELERYPNSVASLSHNHDGSLLAVASSWTYQEANEREEAPQIFVHEIDYRMLKAVSAAKGKKQTPKG